MAEEVMSRTAIFAAEKLILQRNIRNIRFVDASDKLQPLKCGHCDQVAICHVQLKCGHILCLECFPIFHLKLCPARACKELVDETKYDLSSLDDELSNLKVFCKYQRHGCDTVVSLYDLLSHEKSCPFSNEEDEEMQDLMKCKEDIRDLKRQVAEFRAVIQPLLSLGRQKSTTFNKDLDDTILEKVKTESVNQRKQLEAQLTVNFQKYIDDQLENTESKMEAKLLSKYEKDFKILEEKLYNPLKQGSYLIKSAVSNEILTKLNDEVANIKRDVKKDLSRQREDLKKTLEETSKAFIRGLHQVEFEENEKKVFYNIKVTCQKYLGELKTDLNNDFEAKLKQNAESERTILLKNIKSQVNYKGSQIKQKTIEELNKELTNRLENENMKLETSLITKYESEKFKIKNDLTETLTDYVEKQVLASKLSCDISSLSDRLNVLLPKSTNLHWEIQNFQEKYKTNQMTFQSQVFHLYEIGCKLKFTFRLFPKMDFEVTYVKRPYYEFFPLRGNHRITFILEDQIDNQPRNSFIRIFEPTLYDSINYTLLHCDVTKEEVEFLQSRWLKNGKLEVKIILEPLSLLIALEPRHYGHVTWKIDNYKEVRKSHQYTRQYLLSDAFYTSEKGYRIKGLLWIGKEVYFRLVFLKNYWEKELYSKFKHKTTISLISQKNPMELKDKTVSLDCYYLEDDIFRGKFTEEDFENYVKDDSLIISIKVETL